MYCSKCGKEIADNSQFCNFCGAAIGTAQEGDSSKRKVVYEGNQHKCPHCGTILNSFQVRCPSCNYEIRDGKVSSAIRDFQTKLLTYAYTDAKCLFIKTYVVPNTKEDIKEFSELAKNNILMQDSNGDGILNASEKELAIAWKTLFNQCYSKAMILFENYYEKQEFENAKRQVDNFDARINKISTKNIKIFQRQSNNNYSNNTSYQSSSGCATGCNSENTIPFLLCLFFGYFGAHKFYEGEIGMGIIYAFTFGLFGIGWLVDLFNYIRS